MPVQKHVHKYKRMKLGTGKGYIVYQCVLPDCTHYLPEKQVIGKKNICWVCGKQHVVHTSTNGLLAKPHCKDCTKGKKGKKEELEEILTFDPSLFNIPDIMP